jgi:hypothetical protein
MPRVISAEPSVTLIYDLPIDIYYALQLRTPLSLPVCTLLTAANIAMLRMGTVIEAGRSQLMLYYKLLAPGLTSIGLFGLLQRYCLCG